MLCAQNGDDSIWGDDRHVHRGSAGPATGDSSQPATSAGPPPIAEPAAEGTRP